MSEIHDPARLASLAAWIRGSRQAPALDALAAEVARSTGRPIALVSLVLPDAQVFAGAHGLDGWLAQTRGTPLEWSFCAHVVREDAALDVPDSAADPRFRDNPLVLNDGVAAYQGVPLRAPDGQTLGSLCVLTDGPATLDPDAWRILEEASRRAVALLLESP